MKLVSVFSVICVFLWATRSSADFDLTIQISDNGGDTVETASIQLIGLRSQPDIYHQCERAINVPHQSGGRYQVAIKDDDRRLLRHTEVAIAIASPGHALKVLTVSQHRIRSGVPIAIRTARAKKQSIQVVDSTGQPIDGVVLSPASFGGKIVPLYDGISETPPTDSSGRTAAVWIDPGAVSMVYAVGNEIGKQRLPIHRRANGTLAVIAIDTIEVEGTWNVTAAVKKEHEKLIEKLVGQPLRVIVTTDDYSVWKNDDAAYAWAETEVLPDGKIAACRLIHGNLVITADFPQDLGLTSDMGSRPFEAADDFKLALRPGIRVSGSVVDSASASPLSGILVQHFSQLHDDRLTSSDGKFVLWTDPVARITYHSLDVVGRHRSSGAFYDYPQELPTDGQLDLPPKLLQRCSEVVGTVVDPDGEPVAGAKVNCQFKVERFARTETFFSDANGKFPFSGLLDDWAVSLTAMTDDQMTQHRVALKLSPDAAPRLVVHPRPAVKVIGRVVDDAGEPVVGATVTVRKRSIIQAENYRGIDASAINLFDAGTLIRSGADGNFQSPKILDWNQPLSVSVRAAGYRPINTYWKNASIAGKAGEDLDLGTLVMRDQWLNMPIKVTVVDRETDAPIADAKIACLGAYVDGARSVTDAKGKASLTIPDAKCVIACLAKDHHLKFLIRRPGTSTEIIQLDRRMATAEKSGTDFEAKAINEDQKQELARRLVELIPKPATTDSINRLSSYYRALSIADFDQMLVDAKEYAAKPDMKEQVQMLVAMMDWLDEEQVDQLLPLMGASHQFGLNLRRSGLTTSLDKKLDLLGEAMVELQKQTGDEALVNVGRLADCLLRIGETETAMELLSNAWSDHPKLDQILAKGERNKTAGVARLYLPVYAVVDPVNATELIELTAFADEVDLLKTLAVRYAVQFGGRDVGKLCQELNLSKLDSRGLIKRHLDLKPTGLQSGRQIAAMIDDDICKADYLMSLAESSDAPTSDQMELARQALKILKSDSVGTLYFQPCHWLAEKAPKVAQWDPALAQEYLFEAFWTRHPSTRITAFHRAGELARIIAPYEPAVARALVQPCLDDWSWMFGDMDRWVMFAEMNPLNAAAAIDADWTIQSVSDLFEQHLADHPDRQIEVVHGIVTSMVKD